MATYQVTIKEDKDVILAGVGAREIAMVKIDETIEKMNKMLLADIGSRFDATYVFELGPYTGDGVSVLSTLDPFDPEEDESDEIKQIVVELRDRIFNAGDFWVCYKDTYEAAKARMERLGLDKHNDYIFSNWNSWNEHLEWLLVAEKEVIEAWIGDTNNLGIIPDDTLWIASYRRRDSWISVEEELPEKNYADIGDEVIVKLSYPYERVASMKFCDGEFFTGGFGSIRVTWTEYVTHWMPLPKYGKK